MYGGQHREPKRVAFLRGCAPLRTCRHARLLSVKVFLTTPARLGETLLGLLSHSEAILPSTLSSRLHLRRRWPAARGPGGAAHNTSYSPSRAGTRDDN